MFEAQAQVKGARSGKKKYLVTFSLLFSPSKPSDRAFFIVRPTAVLSRSRPKFCYFHCLQIVFYRVILENADGLQTRENGIVVAMVITWRKAI